jgi:hypothetical protein
LAGRVPAVELLATPEGLLTLLLLLLLLQLLLLLLFLEKRS